MCIFKNKTRLDISSDGNNIREIILPAAQKADRMEEFHESPKLQLVYGKSQGIL